MSNTILLIRLKSRSTINFIGGGEIGLDKLIKEFSKRGYSIKEAHIPYIEGRFGKFYFLTRTANLFFKLLLNKKSDKSHVHFSGYYGKTRILEFCIIWIVRKLYSKSKLIFELRGGYLQNTNTFDKPWFKILKKIDFLFIQIPIPISLNTINYAILPNYFDQNTIQFNPNLSSICLGYLGRLDKEKGLMEILDALLLLKNDFPQIRLKIAGKGPMQKNIEERILALGLSENVQLLGFIERNEIAVFWKDVDYFPFLSSNLFEGQSNALTEALACGVIPLASALNSNLQILPFEPFILRKIDAKLIRDRIFEIESADERNAFKRQALFISKRFTSREFQKALDAVYSL